MAGSGAVHQYITAAQHQLSRHQALGRGAHVGALARDGQQAGDVIQEDVHGPLAAEQGYLLVEDVAGMETTCRCQCSVLVDFGVRECDIVSSHSFLVQQRTDSARLTGAVTRIRSPFGGVCVGGHQVSDLLQQEHHHVEPALAANPDLGPRRALRHHQVTRPAAERNNPRSRTGEGEGGDTRPSVAANEESPGQRLDGMGLKCRNIHQMALRERRDARVIRNPLKMNYAVFICIKIVFGKSLVIYICG